MSDREDRKLREVAVGRYGYRHEAEFAAGFLEDAGIPYRLQMNDPSMGMPLAASAILWVHAMDAERATDILDTGGEVLDEGASSSEGDAGSERGARSEADQDDEQPGGDHGSPSDEQPGGVSRGDAGPGGYYEPEGHDEPEGNEDLGERGALRRSTAHVPRAPAPARQALGTRPRLLALAAGVALLSIAVLGVLPGTLLAASAGVVGAGLSLVALLGRAPDPVRRALTTLSGDLT